MRPTTGQTPDPGSGGLSLLELRRQLLKRASVFAVRSKALRSQGNIAAAKRAHEQAARLLRAARRMGGAGRRS